MKATFVALVALALTLLSGAAATTPPPTPAPFQQERVFFGNLHSHTSFSDGSGTPEEAFRFARDDSNAELDFLALTEHNHAEALGPDNLGIGADAALYKGPRPDALIPAARRMTEDGRFVALYGQEFSTISSGNHVNVFDVGEVITVQKGRFDLLLTFLASNRDSFGQAPVIMLNHPNNTLTVDAREYGRDDFPTQDEWVRRMGSQARLIQIINGPGQAAGENMNPARPDEDAYFKYLNLGFKVAPTADQDNHQRNWGAATPARTAVVATSLTKASVIDALRRRRVYATEDRNLSVIIRVNGRLCGDVIAPVPVGPLSIEYDIRDADEPNAQYEIQVFRDSVGGPTARMVTSVETETGGGRGTVEDIAISDQAQYIFFKVVQTDESGRQNLAWTAPVWFQSQPEAVVTPGGGGGGGGTGGGGGNANTTDAAVASRRSNTFHVSTRCFDAQRISPQNLIRGAEARRGRNQHQGCPRTTGPR
ncbi:MAG: CehA/McbA family metallohydrolase [Pyrinomonadaceae bacterium]